MQKYHAVRALEHMLDAGLVVCHSITEKTNEQWTDLIRWGPLACKRNVTIYHAVYCVTRDTFYNDNHKCGIATETRNS